MRRNWLILLVAGDGSLEHAAVTREVLAHTLADQLVVNPHLVHQDGTNLSIVHMRDGAVVEVNPIRSSIDEVGMVR